MADKLRKEKENEENEQNASQCYSKSCAFNGIIQTVRKSSVGIFLIKNFIVEINEIFVIILAHYLRYNKCLSLRGCAVGIYVSLI